MDASPNRCRSCAVVGNSGNLKGSLYGALIDTHDLIIRMNNAVIKDYEKDVGKRTSLHVMYPESAIDLDNTTHLVLFPFKTDDLRWLISAFTTGSIKHTYKTVKAKIKANKDLVMVLNPAFIKFVYDICLEKKGRYPSTGFLALMLSMQICDEVNVFGFGADKDGNWHHYWEPLRNKKFKTGLHSGVHEYNFLMQLFEKKKLHIFRGW
ncbi:CMP-N-acetylneuraminate-beta-galactosamide-alpha-2,3-sialyltransferase 1-like [Aplochiton taeniatus]